MRRQDEAASDEAAAEYRGPSPTPFVRARDDSFYFWFFSFTPLLSLCFPFVFLFSFFELRLVQLFFVRRIFLSCPQTILHLHTICTEARPVSACAGWEAACILQNAR
jgi:hypothetical protein